MTRISARITADQKNQDENGSNRRFDPVFNLSWFLIGGNTR
jgi:hypothetical protein